jgi:hypothetical protein
MGEGREEETATYYFKLARGEGGTATYYFATTV